MRKITRRKFCKGVVATAIVAGVSDSLEARDKAPKAKPFVKWAGGKGQLLDQLDALFPRDFATREGVTYVEPVCKAA